MTYRLLVTGCRDWTDREAVADALTLLQSMPQVLVVHGACPTGADEIAENWCLLRGIKTERHPAKWTRPDGSKDHGAGLARNVEMAKAGADHCLAFWDGRSTGTLHMIAQAVARGIPVRIVPRARR